MPGKGKFKGEIVVASRIIDYLSSGLYKSPAACLKELINNAYDADAEEVNVFIKPDADRIIIEDNGIGINQKDFIENFSRISESHKRDKSDFTESGRPKIGKIGIGFIAANEICNVMEIYSTKANSRELLHVSINFDLMRKTQEKRRRGKDDFAKGDFEGEVTLEANRSDHFTHIFLTGIRGEAQRVLVSAQTKTLPTDAKSIYGLSPESVRSILASKSLRSWGQLDSYSENLLHVALNVPIRYHENWAPAEFSRKVKTFEDAICDLNFYLFFDGSEVRKPIVLGANGGQYLFKTLNFDGENVSAKGYFFAQNSTLHPQNLNGLMLRIRNAAIGEYDSTYLDFPAGTGALFQNWISAEIWADDRLEDAMNIDRRTLRDTHQSFVELREFVHTELKKFISEVRKNLYQTGSKKRKKEKSEREAKSLQIFARTEIAPVSQASAKTIEKEWSSKNPLNEEKLLKKYSVLEFYRLVVEVAQEVLSKDLFVKFLDTFTRRLRRRK